MSKSQSDTKRSQRSGWKLWLEIVLAVAAFGYAGYFILSSPFFNIKQIRLDGVENVNVGTVCEAANVPLKTNIFIYWLKQRQLLCQRVIQANPGASAASLAIDLPNTLLLHIREREPYAILRLQNGYSYLIDSTGVPFKEVQPNQYPLPVINVPAPSGTQLKAGVVPPPQIDDSVSSAFGLMSLLVERNVASLSDYREISVDSLGNVNLRLSNNLIIMFGQPDGMADRLTDLETFLTAEPSLISTSQYLNFTTNRYAVMKKPALLSSVTSGEQPTGAEVPLSSSLGH